jgi:hypothetical protein
MRAARWTVLVCLLALSLGAGRGAGALECSDEPASPALERRLFDLVNAQRTAHGLPAFGWSDALAATGRDHAAVMADAGRIFHNDGYLTGPFASEASHLGENVGTGCSVEVVHDAFMNSAVHRANVLHAELTLLGVGIVTGSEGRLYLVQDFMTPAAAPAPAPPAPAPVAEAAPPRAEPQATAPPPPPITQAPVPDPEPAPVALAALDPITASGLAGPGTVALGAGVPSLSFDALASSGLMLGAMAAGAALVLAVARRRRPENATA